MPDKKEKYFYIFAIIFSGLFYLAWEVYRVPRIEATRRERDIRETLANNPTAYLAQDGTIKYDKPSAEPKNSALFQNTGNGPTAPSNAPNVKEGRPPSAQNIANDEVITKFEESVSRELGKAGFTAHEADVIFNEIKSGLKSGVINSLDIAKETAAVRLSLNSDQKQRMAIAIGTAMDDTGGAYSIEVWESCFEKRIEQLKLNDCDQTLAMEYRDFVRAHAENGRITFAVHRLTTPLEMDLVKRSVKQCNRDFKTAASIFSVNLIDCN